MTVNGVNPGDNSGKQIQAYDGISVDAIRENGTKADVRAINIYDTNNDGYLTGTEVSVFNNTKRTLSDDGTTLIITNQQDGKNQEYKITSSNDLLDSQSRYVDGKTVREGNNLTNQLQQMELHSDGITFMQFSNPDGDDSINHYVGGSIQLGENGKVDINVDTGNVTIDGAEGTRNMIAASNVNLTIKDSEFETINAWDSNLTLDGVHDRTLFFETKTDVKLDGKSTLNHSNSSINVNEE